MISKFIIVCLIINVSNIILVKSGVININLENTRKPKLTDHSEESEDLENINARRLYENILNQKPQKVLTLKYSSFLKNNTNKGKKVLLRQKTKIKRVTSTSFIDSDEEPKINSEASTSDTKENSQIDGKDLSGRQGDELNQLNIDTDNNENVNVKNSIQVSIESDKQENEDLDKKEKDDPDKQEHDDSKKQDNYDSNEQDNNASDKQENDDSDKQDNDVSDKQENDDSDKQENDDKKNVLNSRKHAENDELLTTETFNNEDSGENSETKNEKNDETESENDKRRNINDSVYPENDLEEREDEDMEKKDERRNNDDSDYIDNDTHDKYEGDSDDLPKSETRGNSDADDDGGNILGIKNTSNKEDLNKLNKDQRTKTSQENVISESKTIENQSDEESSKSDVNSDQSDKNANSGNENPKVIKRKKDKGQKEEKELNKRRYIIKFSSNQIDDKKVVYVSHEKESDISVNNNEVIPMKNSRKSIIQPYIKDNNEISRENHEYSDSMRSNRINGDENSKHSDQVDPETRRNYEYDYENKESREMETVQNPDDDENNQQQSEVQRDVLGTQEQNNGDENAKEDIENDSISIREEDGKKFMFEKSPDYADYREKYKEHMANKKEDEDV